MNTKEVINQQIELLAQINSQLASQVTAEAAREIRENTLAIVKLTGIQEGVKIQGVLEDLEERLEALEDVLFGDEDIEKLDTAYGEATLARYIKDCREDLDNIYDFWGPALDRHLGANWCDDAGEKS